MADDVEKRLAMVEAALEKSLEAQAAYKKEVFTAAASKFSANPNIASAQQFLKELEKAQPGEPVPAATPTITVVTVTTVTLV
jgi:hypothetical protein